MEAVEGLVPVADAPAGQAHLDVVNIRLVVAVAVRDEQQVRRRAKPQSAQANRHGRRAAATADRVGEHGEAEHAVAVVDRVVVGAVVGLVRERITAEEAASGGVGKATVGGEAQRAIRDVGNQHGRQRTILDVAVVGQDTRGRDG